MRQLLLLLALAYEDDFMNDVPQKQSGTSGYSWKLSAAAAVASAIGAVVSFGDVSPIITGLILLTAVGWGLTARDNRRGEHQERNR